MPFPKCDPWIHPSVILVATDLSDLDHLVPFAFNQAIYSGARLLFLHVVSPSESLTADISGMPYYDPAGAFENASKGLEPVCAAARDRDIVCEAMVREGNPVREIGAVARQFRANRLLLGTRSRSKLGKFLLGSVAEQVLRSVNLPVITVGPEARLQLDECPQGGVVIHATTLREASHPSAVLACKIAASQGAKLVLLHVLPPETTHSMHLVGSPLPHPGQHEDSVLKRADWGGQSAGAGSAALEELAALAGETSQACNAVVEPHVVYGNPSIEILAEASARHASLIVLGARHRSVFEDLTRDRTIYRVLAHARCPVLTLREQEP
jgi:nucleotide-binding universal stress UspA family protein